MTRHHAGPHERSAPLASFGDLRWLDDAACADLTLAEFFVATGHVLGARAQAACRRCPVRPACAEHAYRLKLAHGYFAGLSPKARETLPHAEQAVARFGAEQRTAAQT